MYDKALVKAVQDYLHAEESLKACRINGSDDAGAERTVHLARRALTQQVAAYPVSPDSALPMRRILVAISDRDEDRRAVELAANLAQAFGGKIGMVHVVDLALGFSPEAGFPARSLIEKQYAESAELLEQARQQIPQSVEVEQYTREGHAGAEIAALAEEWSADLIVAGTHGGGRIAHFLRGSTVEDVIHRARCPVLVVGHEAPVETAEAIALASVT